jgi:hypothetical protein
MRFAGASVAYFAIAGYWAARRELWYDEIFVATLAGLGSPMQIWSALAIGADNHPPLYYWLAWLCGGSDFGVRVPAMVSSWGAIACVFAFVRRAAGERAAWVSAGLMLASESALWAVQARSYALTVLCAAGALLLWQRRRSGWMAVMLAAGMWSGWYGVVTPFALMAGQWVRDRRDGRAWVCLTLPWLSLAPLLGLMGAASEYRAGFWAAPKVTKLATAYGEMFGYAALALALGLAASAWFVHREDGKPGSQDEAAAACASALLPLVVFAIAVLGTNAFHARAASVAAPGMCAGAAMLLARRARALVWPVLAVGVFHFTAMPMEFPHQNVRSIMRAYEMARGGGRPVLLDGELYLPAARYAAGGKEAMALVGEGDHVSLALERLGRVAGVRRSHGERAFRLVTWKRETWERLRREGYEMRWVGGVGEMGVWDVGR